MTTPGTCANCGARDQAGSFCDRCGAVLSWSQTPTPNRPPEEAAPTAEVPAVPRPDQAPQPEPPPDRRVHPAPEAPPQAAQQPPGPPAQGGRQAARDERARRLLIPVTPESQPPPPPQGPTPVLPGRPEPARPQVRRAEHPQLTGGVPCPWCDTPNPPDRNFCRQCAMPLAAADKKGYRTRTWWERLLGIGNPSHEAPWAGERPRIRRGPNGMVLLAVLAVFVVPLVWVAALKIDDAANGIVDHFVPRAPTSVSAPKASHSDPNHGPALAFDGLKNTFWGNGYGGGGQGVSLEASFVQPLRILNVIITPGISAQPDKYATQARPQILNATVFSSDGTSKTTALHLIDGPGPQKLKLRGDNVVRVRLTISSAYGVADDRQVCIAEVEFFTRSTLKTL